MARGRGLLELLSRRPVRKAWYVFVIVFFLLLILLPTVYVLTYMVTGWDDIAKYVLSDTKSATVEWSESQDPDFASYEVHSSIDPDFYPDSSTLRILIDARNGDVSLSRAQATNNTIVNGLEPQDHHYFRIRVVDSSGLGTISDLRREDNSPRWQSPLSPELYTPYLENGSVKLNWTISDELDFDAYDLYVSSTNGFVPDPSTLNTTVTERLTNTTTLNLTSAGVYYFRLRSLDGDSNWAESNQQCIAFGVPSPSFDCVSPKPPQIEYMKAQSTIGWIWDAIVLSLEVAIVATIINFLVGLPMAWFLVRKDFKWKDQLNTLIDVPLAFPTAATGFSAALFWGMTPGVLDKPVWALSMTSSAAVLLIVLEIVFTFPYMVRSLASILEEIDVEYEVVARTCGASRLTAARTITLPMFRAGLVTAVTLCLAKTLSETGGVMAALAAISTREVNATALIGTWKSASVFNSTLIPSLAFLSFILIIISLLLIAVSKLIITRAKLPFKKVFPALERRLSRGWIPKAKDVATFLFLALVVLLPAFFIFSYIATPHYISESDLAGFWGSLGYSFFVAGLVTLVVLMLGIPMGILIARSKNKILSRTMDTLSNVPFVVPTAALGFSLGLFWSTQNIIPIPSDVLVIIMAHIAFTFPYVVRNVVGALEQLSPEYEETARTLGGKPIQVFRKVTFPLIKMSILSGAIMTFTRSVGETGATIAVSPEAITAPVYIVSLIQSADYYVAGIASAILIAFSFTIIMLMRWFIRRRR